MHGIKDERDVAQAYPVPLTTENGVDFGFPFPVPLLISKPVRFAFPLDLLSTKSLAASR